MGVETPSHHCTEFEQSIWTENRQTILLSSNSVYGLYTPSHNFTDFEQCIWTVQTVTHLY